MVSPEPVVAEGSTITFGTGALRRQVLFDITTTIPAGEIVIVTGPSGSGKTTLLTLVGALRSAQEGSVRVLGPGAARRAGRRARGRCARRIGFIFQQHNLLAALTAAQNVELGLRVTGTFGRAQNCARGPATMLEAVGLGGTRRQAARPAVGRPASARRDRPRTGRRARDACWPTSRRRRSTSTSGREVVDRMQALAREQGATILLVTHDNRILDVADRILHLEDGRSRRSPTRSSPTPST